MVSLAMIGVSTGAMCWSRGERLVVVISSIEHHAILDPAHWLHTHEGAEVIQVPVNTDGVIDLHFLRTLVADRASEETDRALELRTRDRQRKLISKIDAALRRVDEGEFGYCDETGEPISLKRLDARPIATMSLEAQERHERREKVHRDD